jgi:hypothetical protein
MVANVSEELGSSENEGVSAKKWSTGLKIMVDNDDEAATDTDIEKLCSSTEPNRDPSRDCLRNDSRDLMEGTAHGEVDTNKKKKEWKIQLDSDCSLDEEISSSLLSVAKNTKGSDDDESSRHSAEQDPLLHFSLMKESDLYDADGSEDEAVPRHKLTGKSKPKGRCFSQRKTKVSGTHVRRVPPSSGFHPISWATWQLSLGYLICSHLQVREIEPSL